MNTQLVKTKPPAAGSIPAALVAKLPSFRDRSRYLTAEGFVLSPQTCPMLGGDGRVLLRLVWRQREMGEVIVVQKTLTGTLPPELQDALAKAFDF